MSSKGVIFNTCFAKLKELIAQWDSLGVFFTQKYVVEHFIKTTALYLSKIILFPKRSKFP